MKTRYSRALWRATTSAGASPAAAATASRSGPHSPPVLDRNLDGLAGGSLGVILRLRLQERAERVHIGAQGVEEHGDRAEGGDHVAHAGHAGRAHAGRQSDGAAVDGDVDHVAEVGDQRRVSSVANPRPGHAPSACSSF